MSFFDFDLPRIERDFGLTIASNRSLFATVPAIAISMGLRAYWENLQPLGLSLVTEKARSEFLVAPLLGEVWHRSGRTIAVLSGIPFVVDRSTSTRISRATSTPSGCLIRSRNCSAMSTCSCGRYKCCPGE